MVSLETTDKRAWIYLQQLSGLPEEQHGPDDSDEHLQGSHLHEHLSEVEQPQLLAHWQALLEEGLGQGQTILANIRKDVRCY